MSEPTRGPYFLHRDDGRMSVYPETWRGEPNREVRKAIIASVSPWDGASQHNRSELMAEAVANGHLLAASWEMREALQAVHDWRGLCDADDLETFERIGEMFQRDTGYLRPGKDDPRLIGEGAEAERDRKWNEWITKKNGEINARIRAALAASRGEAQ